MNTNKQYEKKTRKKKKWKKKNGRVLPYSSTCNKLTKQYITNCPEMRRLQFSATNIFNVFWISYTISKRDYNLTDLVQICGGNLN